MVELRLQRNKLKIFPHFWPLKTEPAATHFKTFTEKTKQGKPLI